MNDEHDMSMSTVAQQAGEGERERGQGQATDAETVAELQAIIADETLPESEREAAKELLAELGE